MKKLLISLFVAASLITYSVKSSEKQNFVSSLNALKQRLINYWWGVPSTAPTTPATPKQTIQTPITQKATIDIVQEPADDEYEEPEKFEDMTELMVHFKNSSELKKETQKEQVDEIISLLCTDATDHADFIRIFNNDYDPETKKRFAELFFASQKRNLSFGIRPQGFTTIVRSKFIQTNENNEYVFFIDENYKIGVKKI